MAQIILIFDVSDNVLAFRHALVQIGYKHRIDEEGLKGAWLPANSMYHPNKSLDDCVKEAKAIGFELGAFLTRCVALPISSGQWSGISGQ